MTMIQVATLINSNTKLITNDNKFVQILDDSHSHDKTLIYNGVIFAKFDGKNVTDPSDKVLYTTQIQKSRGDVVKIYYKNGICAFKEEYCSGGGRKYYASDSKLIGTLNCFNDGDIVINSNQPFSISTECPTFLMAVLRQL